MPILEAMACGTPTIANNCASIPEVIGSGNTIDMDSASTIEICNYTIEKMASDIDELALSRSNQFTWEQTALNTLNVYEEVLKT